MMTDKWMTYREVINLYRPDHPYTKPMSLFRPPFALRPLYRATRREDESFTGWISRYFIAGER